MRRWRSRLAAAQVGAALLIGAVGAAQAADHRDAPAISEDSRADLGDLFSFVNKNNGNIVLAMTVNGFTPPQAIGVAFSPNVLYQFKIDNTGDAVEDLVIQARFVGPPLFQAVTVRLVVPSETGPVVSQQPPTQVIDSVTGPADGSVTTGTGPIRRVFAGLRDDPFFVDLPWWTSTLRLLPIPPPARPPGVETHAGLNVSALVVELTPAALRGSTGNVIRTWATTSRPSLTKRSVDSDESGDLPFVQVDRTATPALSPFLQDFKLQDQFNRAGPIDDRRFYQGVVTGTLIRINGDPFLSSQIAASMLPDVQALDMTNSHGFPNGRRPEDDFIDWQLNLWTKGAIKSDHVDANDVPNLADFPFLGRPHPAEEPTRVSP